MIIRDHTTGDSYQLNPDSTLQIERTNPFFNDYGEQSLPLDLPDTPLNRRLTGHPGELANSSRPESGREVDIEDGAYHVRAHRQVLSARSGGSISTSFLLEQSNLYAKIGGRRLIDVFGTEVIDGTAGKTIAQIIEFLDGLKDHQDPHYDIFPVALTATDEAERSFGYKLLNAYGRKWIQDREPGKVEFWPGPDNTSSPMFWLNGSEWPADGYYNDTTLNPQQGYYMSPFIRAIYVLERVMESLGYTLDYPGKDGVGTPDPVMTRMVFVNNTIDACVTGAGILISDLVPDSTCSELLDMFRYKFNQEFIVDDVNSIVTMLPFGTMLDSEPVDLTPYLVGRPQIEYPESHRRIVLTPAATQSGDTAPEIRSMLEKYPAAVFEPVRGGWTVTGHRGLTSVTELVIDGNAGYSIDDRNNRLESDEHKSPDRVPSFVALMNYSVRNPSPVELSYWCFPCIGEERALHSRLSGTTADNSPALEERPALGMMLLLPYTDYGNYPRGTLADYDYYSYYRQGNKRSAGIGGSLCYHGADGLFERYWRRRDNLTRNALNKVQASMLLPAGLKMSLSPMSRVLLHGSAHLIDTLALSLGTESPIESTLLSTTLQSDGTTPPSSAPDYDDESLTGITGYHWELRRTYENMTEEEYTQWRSHPAAQHFYNPDRSFPTQRATAALEGTVCCIQYQYYKVLAGDRVPFLYSWDTFLVEGYPVNVLDPDVQAQIGYSYTGDSLINESSSDKYLYVMSELVCIPDPLTD